MWLFKHLGREMTDKRGMLKSLALGVSAMPLIAAAQAPAQLGSAVPAAAASVSAFYDTWRSQPIWFILPSSLN